VCSLGQGWLRFSLDIAFFAGLLNQLFERHPNAKSSPLPAPAVFNHSWPGSLLNWFSLNMIAW
jgi:hypothetical protein